VSSKTIAGSSEGPGALVGAQEVAAALGVPISWIRERTRAGEVPHYSLGKYRRYRLSEVLAWAEKQKAGQR
jgi:excisionase family DNA binding protein